jgi:hypothetical protein
MDDSFVLKIGRDLGATHFAPLLFDCRIVVVGHVLLANVLPLSRERRSQVGTSQLVLARRSSAAAAC